MNNNSPKPVGCAATSLGCLITMLLLPVCIILFGWLSFAMEPMGCALPNRCTRSQEVAKGLLSLVLLFGGGFGIPIAVGVGVRRGIQIRRQQSAVDLGSSPKE